MSSENQLIKIFESDINIIRATISQENIRILEKFNQNIDPLDGIYFIEYDT